jgi:hypothetical protein
MTSARVPATVPHTHGNARTCSIGARQASNPCLQHGRIQSCCVQCKCRTAASNSTNSRDHRHSRSLPRPLPCPCSTSSRGSLLARRPRDRSNERLRSMCAAVGLGDRGGLSPSAAGSSINAIPRLPSASCPLAAPPFVTGELTVGGGLVGELTETSPLTTV